jgi:hypothetical protein
MQHGDISNQESGRLWFVAEGLVLLPLKQIDHPRLMPGARRIGWRRSLATYVRSSFEVSTWIYKRMWDLAWRFDFRLAIVTFNTTPGWADAIGEYLDEFDIPAPVRGYELDSFKDGIVTLPSCLRVFDPEPARALSFGPKGTYVDPAFDFEPLS